MTSLQNQGLTATLVDQDGKEFCRVFGYYENGNRPERSKNKIEGKKAIGTSVWLAELIDYCDKRGLKIRCISTPQTILGDLKHRKVTGCHDGSNGSVAIPELVMLAPFKRQDLYACPEMKPREGNCTSLDPFVSPYGLHERLSVEY